MAAQAPITSLLITGGSGYVGQATCRAALAAGYSVAATCYRHKPDIPGVHWLCLDLREPAAATALVTELHPAAIIHAAAAWDTPAVAQAVIVEGTRVLAAAAAGAGTRFIHLSTDMVFDGEHAPYREADRPAPLAFYGVAKAAAEKLVAATLANHVIVRTSLVTSFDPPDPRTAQVISALQAGPGASAQLTLFSDEYRCPVRTADLAAALIELIAHPYCGILHIAGPERLSRYALGRRIARYFGLDAERLGAGRSSDVGLVRPRDCTLDISLAQRILQTRLEPLP